MAEATDSPVEVTRAASIPPGILYSFDDRFVANFFHGPGESFDISGDGSGVTSVIALNIGLDRAEFGADPP